MNDASPAQSSAIATFRALHESGCFVLPNPWDIGTAVYLQHLGFEALATTSAGFAFSRGLPDTVSAVPRDLMLEHIREVVAGTPVPLNAGFQSAFRVAVERLVAYPDAGADCLYAPGVRDPAEIAAIVKAVSPKPVNVLVSA